MYCNSFRPSYLSAWQLGSSLNLNFPAYIYKLVVRLNLIGQSDEWSIKNLEIRSHMTIFSRFVALHLVYFVSDSTTISYTFISLCNLIQASTFFALHLYRTSSIIKNFNGKKLTLLYVQFVPLWHFITLKEWKKVYIKFLKYKNDTPRKSSIVINNIFKRTLCDSQELNAVYWLFISHSASQIDFTTYLLKILKAAWCQGNIHTNVAISLICINVSRTIS